MARGRSCTLFFGIWFQDADFCLRALTMNKNYFNSLSHQIHSWNYLGTQVPRIRNLHVTTLKACQISGLSSSSVFHRPIILRICISAMVYKSIMILFLTARPILEEVLLPDVCCKKMTIFLLDRIISHFGATRLTNCYTMCRSQPFWSYKSMYLFYSCTYS